MLFGDTRPDTSSTTMRKTGNTPWIIAEDIPMSRLTKPSTGTFGDRLCSADALDCIGGNIVKSTRQLDSRKSNDPPNNRTAL